MGIVAKQPCLVVFLMVLTLGASLGLPAEDVLDDVCDESEALPSEVIPLGSNSSPPLSTTTTHATPNSLHHELRLPSRFSSARVSDTDAHQSADARVSLVLLCTLLC
jgi:hypothetical protein